MADLAEGEPYESYIQGDLSGVLDRIKGLAQKLEGK